MASIQFLELPCELPHLHRCSLGSKALSLRYLHKSLLHFIQVSDEIPCWMVLPLLPILSLSNPLTSVLFSIYSIYRITYLLVYSIICFPPTWCTLFENRDFNFSVLYPQQLEQGWHIIGAHCIFIEWMNNEYTNGWMNKWEQKEWTWVDQKGEITSLLVNKLWNNILFIWLQMIFSIKLITARNRAQSTQPLK